MHYHLPHFHESATSVQEWAARCSKWRQPEKGRRGREKKDAAHGQFVQSRLPVEVEIGQYPSVRKPHHWSGSALLGNSTACGRLFARHRQRVKSDELQAPSDRGRTARSISFNFACFATRSS
jgi:hypothetical protein